MIAIHCETCNDWVPEDVADTEMWTLASPCEAHHVYHFCDLECMQLWIASDDIQDDE